MSALVDAVRARTPQSCRATSCGEEGVSASLEGLTKERVLVNVNCGKLGINRTMRRCDFILACGDDQIAPIELKSGDVKLSEVAKQLNGGAWIVEHRLLPDTSLAVRFRPVVVHGGRGPRRKGRKPTERVKFRGKFYEIKAIHSGSPLTKALSGR